MAADARLEWRQYMDTSDLAMVSRIRVEVRGGSMEACERAAFLALDHAKMAGYLEGIVPSGGKYSDHFFNRPEMTRTFEDGPEDWTELGLSYAGRLTFTFTPEVVRGGLKQYGHEVTSVADFTPHGLAGHEGSETEPVRADVTEKVIVLERKHEVARWHVWDAEPPPEEQLAEASAEEILDRLRDMKAVHYLTVEPEPKIKGWKVGVIYAGSRPPSTYDAETLREAAVAALAAVGET